MVIAFSWKDKIIVMADSRISRQSDSKVTEFYDDRVKIYPVNGNLLISQSGATIIRLDEQGNFLDVSDVISDFVKMNGNREQLVAVEGESAIRDLIDYWNKILLKNDLDPNNYDVNFLLCGWMNGVTPAIYCYSSETNKIDEGNRVIGDKEALKIIYPYIQEDLENKTFEEVLRHYKHGFNKVIQHVETVGGDLHIYELNQNPKLSKWISRPF